jgi:hypothetical protein
MAKPSDHEAVSLAGAPTPTATTASRARFRGAGSPTFPNEGLRACSTATAGGVGALAPASDEPGLYPEALEGLLGQLDSPRACFARGTNP